MPTLLTVSQACKLTGKSESTIKRMVREIVGDSTHSDRGLVEPNPEEVERRKAGGERYTWGIAEELLLRRFPPRTSDESAAATDAEQPPSTGKLVDILREQLGKKDQQIAALETQLDRKDEQLANLSERQRETNILMKRLQDRLALDAPNPKRSLLSRLLRK